MRDRKAEAKLNGNRSPRNVGYIYVMKSEQILQRVLLKDSTYNCEIAWQALGESNVTVERFANNALALERLGEFIIDSRDICSGMLRGLTVDIQGKQRGSIDCWDLISAGWFETEEEAAQALSGSRIRTVSV